MCFSINIGNASQLNLDGDIIAIGLRSVKLQTLTDDTVTIPNNMFLNEITSCGNYGILAMQVSVPFYVGLDQDIELARNIINEATVTSNFVHLPKPIKVIISQVVKENYIAIQLTLKAYVLDTQFEKDFETDVTLRVMGAFRENGIALVVCFPAMTNSLKTIFLNHPCHLNV